MEMGVGLVFLSGFEPALDLCAGLLDVLEVEPQTFWFNGAASTDPPQVDQRHLRYLASLPFPKLVHGVGFPIGSTRPPDPRQLPALKETLRALQPPWFSEHLSFNRARHNGVEIQTGFLLPPRQTAAGIEAAIHSVRALQSELSIPFLIETGVNYLRPLPEEVPDGEFVARVVEGSGCGILLDLHNLWANERNGRQSIADFLDSIPLERVRELHLAGGHEHGGLWLDAHSGAMPEGLFELAQSVVRRLPNLGAVIFELFPGHLLEVGHEVFLQQLQLLRRIWDARGSEYRRQPRPEWKPAVPGESAPPEEWENTLGAMVLGRPASGELAARLSGDPGIPVMQHLIREFRGSVLFRTLKFTCRLLLLHLGDEKFIGLLHRYWKESAPQLFGSEEAFHFGEFLRCESWDIHGLDQVLDFELATIRTLLDGETRVVRFPFDPLPVLRALGESRMPGYWIDREVDLEITPDPPVEERPEAAYALQFVH